MITGGRPLVGRIPVLGAKNAILPIIVASLLCHDEVNLANIPPLEDVRTMCRLLRSLGAGVESHADNRLTIRPGTLADVEPPYELVRLMRASFLVMGPLVARTRRARIALPGGCAIGSRPIDLHLKGFAALGARVSCDRGHITVEVDRLRGSHVYLDYPSVTATENIIMAAATAPGETVLENVSQEPEVVDLANFLNAAGARIAGAGTGVIRIQGVSDLGGADHQVIPDRIEAGTYMIAAAITCGDVYLENVVAEHLKPIMAKLREMGVQILDDCGGGLRVRMRDRPRAADVKTMPHPGFPTDLQAPIMALLTLAEGTSVITETVFENRFGHVDELKRMGASIRIEGHSAFVQGTAGLTGAPVRATDLRAGAALVLAALAADGTTEVADIRHIDRGYADLAGRLAQLGADVERVQD